MLKLLTPHAIQTETACKYFGRTLQTFDLKPEKLTRVHATEKHHESLQKGGFSQHAFNAHW